MEDQSANGAVDIPGAPRMTAPAADDHRAWAAWLCETALPQVQPLRMPQQRFEYWSRSEARRARPAGADPVSEGALG